MFRCKQHMSIINTIKVNKEYTVDYGRMRFHSLLVYAHCDLL